MCPRGMQDRREGAMPHEMFIQNVERFGKEVLPAVQAHAVTTVPIS